MSDECIICYEKINSDDGNVTLKCKHTYCVACFIKHMRKDNKCAMCRVPIENVDMPIEDKLPIPEEDISSMFYMISESMPLPVYNEQPHNSAINLFPNLFSNFPFINNLTGATWVERDYEVSVASSTEEEEDYIHSVD